MAWSQKFRKSEISLDAGSERKTQNQAGVDSCSPVPVSSEISDLCVISDLLLFLSYFSSQSKGIKFGNYFFDVRCVN